MRYFVASDDMATAAKVRNIIVELGLSCPASQVNTVERVWGDLKHGVVDPHEKPSKVAEDSPKKQSAVDLDIVVVVLAPDPERAMGFVRDNRRKTTAKILTVGSVADAKLVLRALREGANDFLDQANLKSEFVAALNRLSSEASSGKLITLLSASGGCGCSTLAVNLAVGLAKTHRSCAAMDLKLEFGDLATLLDAKPSVSIADLCNGVRRLDPGTLESCLIPHFSGVQLLASAGDIADRKPLTEDDIHAVTSMIVRSFPFAIVDLGNSFRSERTRVLMQSELILIVIRLDFPCLRNTRAALDYLAKIGVAQDKIQVIANRNGRPSEIAPAAAEEALGVKISHYVPDDAKSVNWANNNGIPVLLESPSAKISKAIADLAAGIVKASARHPQLSASR